MALQQTASFDLVVAVSFGRLIPAELLAATPHGGLNVHPSLLPRYSGASPIQYALLNDDRTTGVTVQTLHPTQFDRGALLLQRGGIPVHDHDNYVTLADRLGVIGGELLTQTIEQELFVHPQPIQSEYEYSYAPKFTTADHLASWHLYDARQIYRRSCALGQLYTFVYCETYSKAQKRTLKGFKRVILDDLKQHPPAPAAMVPRTTVPGEFFFDAEANRLVIHTADGSSVSCGSLLMETFKREDAKQFWTRLAKRTGSSTTRFSDGI